MIALLLLLAAPTTTPRVAVTSIPGTAWAEASVTIRGGTDEDTKPGVAHVTSLLLAERLRRPVLLGRSGLVIRWGAPTTTIEAECRDVLSKVARPVITKEVDRAVKIAAERRRRFVDDDHALAEAELLRMLLGAPHRLGTIEALATITSDDVTAYLRRNLNTERIRFAAAGQVPDSLEASLKEGTEALRRPDTPHPKRKWSAERAKGVRILLVDKPDRARAVIYAGKRAKYTAANVRAAASAGGAPSSPLGRLGARAQMRADHLRIVATSDPAQLTDRLAAILGALRRLEEKGADDEELALGAAVISTRALLAKRDAAAVVDEAARTWLLGEPFGPTETGLVQSSVRALANTDDLVVVIVAGASAALQQKLLSVPNKPSIEVVRYDLR